MRRVLGLAFALVFVGLLGGCALLQDDEQLYLGQFPRRTTLPSEVIEQTRAIHADSTLTDRQKGERLLPFIKEGMRQSQVYEVLGGPDPAGFYSGNPAFYWPEHFPHVEIEVDFFHDDDTGTWRVRGAKLIDYDPPQP